jgi:hypothetical protein
MQKDLLRSISTRIQEVEWHLFYLSAKDLCQKKAAETRYDVYFHFDQFLSMMQMLREEKPIYFHYSDSKYAQVSTNPEPKGEAEIG